MILHVEIPGNSFSRLRSLLQMVHEGKVLLAGNKKLHIYGTLQCSSGKRMKMINRIFFQSATEAIAAGYRPCSHCMRKEYTAWKQARGLHRGSQTAP